jgi:hypothetical protein
MLRSCVLSLALAAGVSLAPVRADDRPSATNLVLEIEALQTLRHFEMTATQMELLRKLAADTASKEKRQPGKVSANYRRTLLDLREALVKNDEERIGELEEKREALEDKEEPDVDDDVEITAAARKSTGEVLAALTPRQVGAFVTNYPYELPDPLERLLDTLDITGKLKDGDWKLVVEDISEDLSWQLGGLDSDRSKAAGKQIERFLAAVRAGKMSRTELGKAARQLVGQVPATLVLHNIVEHTLAELLSNPRLAAAIDARQKK